MRLAQSGRRKNQLPILCLIPEHLVLHHFSEYPWGFILSFFFRSSVGFDYGREKSLCQFFIDNNPSTRAWTDTAVEGLKAFVGLLILMGIVRLPRLELYWSTSFPLIRTPGISSIMPLIRFEQLWRFLHLTDNNNMARLGMINYSRYGNCWICSALCLNLSLRCINLAQLMRP